MWTARAGPFFREAEPVEKMARICPSFPGGQADDDPQQTSGRLRQGLKTSFGAE